jgi:hypothetical protein
MAEPWGILDENKLLESALADIPQLELVHQASLALGFSCQEFDETKCVNHMIGKALSLMAVMGF